MVSSNRPADDEAITVIVEQSPNSLHKRFFTNVELCEKQIVTYEHPLRPYQMGIPEVGVSDHEVGMNIIDWAKIGEVGRQMIVKVLDISGVERVTIRPYEMAVMISRAFKWDNIDHKVLDVFREVLNTTDIVIEAADLAFTPAVRSELPADPFGELADGDSALEQ